MSKKNIKILFFLSRIAVSLQAKNESEKVRMKSEKSLFTFLEDIHLTKNNGATFLLFLEDLDAVTE